MKKLFNRQKTNPVFFGTRPFFSCCTYSLSQTTVSGNVSGIWSGQTLSIDPEAAVDFQGHYKLNVEGRLLAIGTQTTQTDAVVFTATDISQWN